MSIIQQHRHIIEETAEQHGWSLLSAEHNVYSPGTAMTFKRGKVMVAIHSEVFKGKNDLDIIYVKHYLGGGKFKTFRHKRFHMRYLPDMFRINGDIHIKLGGTHNG